jgi:hypothetical protein
MPYMWGTTGVTYDADKIEARIPNAPIDSYDLIFDPDIISKFSDCGVSFLDDPTSVVPMGMIYLGYPFNSVEPEHLKAVEELFTAVRPYIKYFSSSKLAIDLPSGEVCMAKAAPWIFLHIEQWQWQKSTRSASTSYCTPPHAHSPVITMAPLFSSTPTFSVDRSIFSR